MSTTAPPATAAKPVTLITQTRVRPERNDDFAVWQQRISDAVAKFPGFIDHKVMPPNPPTQTDWVIVQRFASSEQARTWLRSPERLRLVSEAQPMLIGHDDIHLVEDDAEGRPPEAISAVISMRIVPGQEGAFQAWSQRIAAAQAHYPGFQGFKVNPPIPGVQEDWVTVLQFDTEPHLNAWMTSPERLKLLEEAKPFTADTHYRTVRSGFDQWFRVGGAAHAPVWKQNMLVLLALYPTVFLFGFFVQTPILMRQLGWPFWLSLFASNVAGVIILNWLVPWVSKRFDWWLQPAGIETEKRNLIGIVVVVVLYGLLLLAFSRFPAALTL
jgi:antibiotic biosynthesis monooxygenase (ABM) superfamily enzyme